MPISNTKTNYRQNKRNQTEVTNVKKELMEFDISHIDYQPPDCQQFFKMMVKQGYKINIEDKTVLETCEGNVQKYGSKRKDIFGNQNIDCHDFYFLLADKYNLDYIKYKLVISSLSAQTLKNLYRHVWVQWEQLKDNVYTYCDENELDDLDEKSVKLIKYIIDYNFKYPPEHIDDIYNKNRILIKILDSFYSFAKKKEIYVNFILTTIYQYFSTDN